MFSKLFTNTNIYIFFSAHEQSIWNIVLYQVDRLLFPAPHNSGIGEYRNRPGPPVRLSGHLSVHPRTFLHGG